MFLYLMVILTIFDANPNTIQQLSSLFPYETSELGHKRAEDLGTQLLVFHCSAETEGRSPPAAEQGKSLVFTLVNSKSWSYICKTINRSQKLFLGPPPFQWAEEESTQDFPFVNSHQSRN